VRGGKNIVYTDYVLISRLAFLAIIPMKDRAIGMALLFTPLVPVKQLYP